MPDNSEKIPSEFPKSKVTSSVFMSYFVQPTVQESEIAKKTKKTAIKHIRGDNFIFLSPIMTQNNELIPEISVDCQCGSTWHKCFDFSLIFVNLC